MDLVVVDPDLLVEVFTDPDGDAARLFLVLAYGRATLLTRFSGAGEDALLSLGYEPRVASAITVPDLGKLCEEAARVKSVLENDDRFPAVVPSGWGLGMTEFLFEDLAGRVERVRRTHDPDLSQKLVRTVVELHVAHYDPLQGRIVASFSWPGARPASLDALLYNGLRLEARYVLTKDERLVGDKPTGRRYSSQHGSIRAVRPEYFAEHELQGGGHFWLDEIERPGDLKIEIVPPTQASPQAPAGPSASIPVRRFRLYPSDN